MLRKKFNPKSGKTEYALLSVSSPGKVLRWFGTEKPGDEIVEKEEKRVSWFKHRRKTLLTGD